MQKMEYFTCIQRSINPYIVRLITFLGPVFNLFAEKRFKQWGDKSSQYKLIHKCCM